MCRNRHRVIILVTLAVWVGLGLLRGPDISQAAPRLKVAATIFPLYDLVRNVAGPAVEVVLLVSPGASPHAFDPKPATIRALTGSAAIFAIGHGLDDWVIRLAQGVDVAQTLIVDQHVALRAGGHEVHDHDATPRQPEPHESVDPHYWLAVPNAIRMVQAIAEALGRLDPTGKEGYIQRASAYGEQLRSLDGEIRQLLANLPRREIATFHQAFDYFAEAYGLHIVATFEPSPGQEPTPRHVEAFLRQVRAHQLRVLFVEPQLPQTSLRGLARDLGVVLQELDPLGGSGERQSYMAMMRFNAAQIAAALGE